MTAQRTIDLGAIAAESAGEALSTAIAGARLVCFPTDTVYGIGGACTPAVARAIVAAKGRESGRPLQMVFPTRDALLAALPLSPALRDVVARLLPGPFTLVVPYPATLDFPPAGEVAWAEGDAQSQGGERVLATLGLRVPRWPRGARHLAALGLPLLASSANRSGEPAPGDLGAVPRALREACDLLLDGGPASGTASTVVDFSVYETDRRWRVLRRGTVTEVQIAELLALKREDVSPL